MKTNIPKLELNEEKPKIRKLDTTIHVIPLRFQIYLKSSKYLTQKPHLLFPDKPRLKKNTSLVFDSLVILDDLQEHL